MNKTLKFVLIFAGSIFILGLMAASFVIGATIFGLRGAFNQPQIARAANANTSLTNSDPVVNSQSVASSQSNPQTGLAATPIPGSPTQNPGPYAPGQSYPAMHGGMMGGWYGQMPGGMMGGMMGGRWNSSGTQVPSQPGACWDCGMHGRGMMGGWGYYGSQNYVIPQPTPNADVSFQRDVLPIFREDCTACHGGTAGLYLDSYANALRGGRSGAVIVPGNPQASLLVQFVASGYMPFRGQRLTDAEIQAMVNWIASGAKDN